MKADAFTFPFFFRLLGIYRWDRTQLAAGELTDTKNTDPLTLKRTTTDEHRNFLFKAGRLETT